MKEHINLEKKHRIVIPFKTADLPTIIKPGTSLVYSKELSEILQKRTNILCIETVLNEEAESQPIIFENHENHTITLPKELGHLRYPPNIQNREQKTIGQKVGQIRVRQLQMAEPIQFIAQLQYGLQFAEESDEVSIQEQNIMDLIPYMEMLGNKLTKLTQKNTTKKHQKQHY